MNPISFDTYIRRDAYRNGWDNCEPDAERKETHHQ